MALSVTHGSGHRSPSTLSHTQESWYQCPRISGGPVWTQYKEELFNNHRIEDKSACSLDSECSDLAGTWGQLSGMLERSIVFNELVTLEFSDCDLQTTFMNLLWMLAMQWNWVVHQISSMSTLVRNHFLDSIPTLDIDAVEDAAWGISKTWNSGLGDF